MSWNFLLKLSFNLFITKEMPREPSQPLRGAKSGMTIWKCKTLWKFWIFWGLWTVPLKEIIGFDCSKSPQIIHRKPEADLEWATQGKKGMFIHGNEGREEEKKGFQAKFHLVSSTKNWVSKERLHGWDLDVFLWVSPQIIPIWYFEFWFPLSRTEFFSYLGQYCSSFWGRKPR